jgi:hypothetical protein
MAFDSTINLGNILTAAGTIIGLFWAYHQWDKRVEIRHIKTIAAFDELNNKMDNIDYKADRVESKVDETRRDVNGVKDKFIELNLKMEKHVISDDIVQREILRRLDKNENGNK